INGTQAVSPLIETLKNDTDIEIRSTAALILGKIGDPQAADPLIESLNESNFWIQMSAIMALGYIKDPRAVAPLIQKLSYQDNDSRNRPPVFIMYYDFFRSLAAEALGEIGDPR